MRQSTIGSLRAEYFDNRVFLQERQRIHVQITDTPIGVRDIRLMRENGDVIGEFQTNAKGEITIDVTDAIRAFRDNMIQVYCPQNDDLLQITFVIGGLADWRRVFHPYSPKASSWNSPGAIVPPSMILDYGQKIVAGSNLTHPIFSIIESMSVRAYTDGEVEDIVPDEFYSFVIPSDADGIDIKHTQGIPGRPGTITYSPKITFQPISCDLDVVVIRWRGFTGAMKQAAFYVKDRGTDVLGGVNLQPSGFNEYSTLKGHEDGCTIFLDKLTSYDYFYYSDIITSQEVMMQSPVDGSFSTVSVETNSVDLPQGDAGQFYTLEISIKYGKYDAVDL